MSYVTASNKLGRALVEDVTGPLDRSLADVQQIGSFLLRQSFANWRTCLTLAVLKSR